MSETVRAFARGLEVIRSFDADRPAMTVAEVARRTELNRATARRLLQTLEELGYARREGDRYRLTARVLDLGYAYVSSLGLTELAEPFLTELSRDIQESASVAVLHETDIVYVARIAAKRVMTTSIGVGTRFPAYRTSLGRVLLSELGDEALTDIWERSDRSAPTPRTVTTFDGLTAVLAETRERGWCLVDQELELGVRSIAAPIRDQHGMITAAMNVSAHASRTTKTEMLRRYLPALLRTADELSHVLASRAA